MSVAIEKRVLPLLVSGLSRTFLGWLRTAGIPFTGYVSGSSLQQFLQNNPARFLLYDSRNLVSRQEAETALLHGCEIIDMAPSKQTGFSTQSDQDAANANSISAENWILSLKRKVQGYGGVWMRIHDLPAGYESVMFQDGLPSERDLGVVSRALLPMSEGSTHIPAPHFPTDHVFSDSTNEFVQNFGCWWEMKQPSKKPDGRYPAELWKTNAIQFSHWWHLRNQIQLNLTVTNETLHIENKSPKLTEHWSPVLEIWRNGHVARVRMDAPSLTLKQTGMVYCREAFRHPAGLFLSQGRAEPISPPVSRSVSQSV